jgi:hypothetical protein
VTTRRGKAMEERWSEIDDAVLSGLGETSPDERTQ